MSNTTKELIPTEITTAQAKLLETISSNEAETYVEALTFVYKEAVHFSELDLDRKDRIHLQKVDELITTINKLSKD